MLHFPALWYCDISIICPHRLRWGKIVFIPPFLFMLFGLLTARGKIFVKWDFSSEVVPCTCSKTPAHVVTAVSYRREMAMALDPSLRCNVKTNQSGSWTRTQPWMPGQSMCKCAAKHKKFLEIGMSVAFLCQLLFSRILLNTTSSVCSWKS